MNKDWIAVHLTQATNLDEAWREEIEVFVMTLNLAELVLLRMAPNHWLNILNRNKNNMNNMQHLVDILDRLNLKLQARDLPIIV